MFKADGELLGTVYDFRGSALVWAACVVRFFGVSGCGGLLASCWPVLDAWMARATCISSV